MQQILQYLYNKYFIKIIDKLESKSCQQILN